MKTRKLQINRFVLAFVGIFLWGACAKDDVDLYEEAPGIYFNGAATTYNFAENPEMAEVGYDTVNIPVLITGTAVDYDRNIKVRIAVEDTVTASNDMYEILEGKVLAGAYSGQIRVKINYVPLMDDSIYVTKLKLESTPDFPVIDLNQVTYHLYMTNLLSQPANWSRLDNFFGNYSNSWYRFILEAANRPSLPYWSYNGSEDPSNPDPERWTMNYAEITAYANLVREALTEYNNQHPGNPLKHEDGEYAGQNVVMP